MKCECGVREITHNDEGRKTLRVHEIKKEAGMKVFDKTWKWQWQARFVGVLAALLAYFGNPANMAICIACFVRDTAGALKLHSAAPVQYFRPEIDGSGSICNLTGDERERATAGSSSPMIRLCSCAIMVIGALVLGCPLRMVLRMARCRRLI